MLERAATCISDLDSCCWAIISLEVTFVLFDCDYLVQPYVCCVVRTVLYACCWACILIIMVCASCSAKCTSGSVIVYLS